MNPSLPQRGTPYAGLQLPIYLDMGAQVALLGSSIPESEQVFQVLCHPGLCQEELPAILTSLLFDGLQQR